jgi:hypothetical protein
MPSAIRALKGLMKGRALALGLLCPVQLLRRWGGILNFSTIAAQVPYLSCGSRCLPFDVGVIRKSLAVMGISVFDPGKGSKR